MKTLKTTLGLFLLSTFLFSLAPQQATAQNTNDITDQIQLQKVYEATEIKLKQDRGED